MPVFLGYDWLGAGQLLKYGVHRITLLVILARQSNSLTWRNDDAIDPLCFNNFALQELCDMKKQMTSESWQQSAKQERNKLGWDVQAMCDFCHRLSIAWESLLNFRPWHARVIAALVHLQVAHDVLRNTSWGCLEDTLFCGSLFDLGDILARWDHAEWGATYWHGKVQQIDLAQRREASRLYAWWSIMKGWHNIPCRIQQPVLFEENCLQYHLWSAMQAVKTTYDWKMLGELYDEIMALDAKAPVSWPHKHQAYLHVIPDLGFLPPVWNPSDSEELEHIVRLLEAHALEIIQESLMFRALPDVYGEENLAHEDYIWKASASAWYRWKFYNNGWNATLCARMKTLCSMMQEELLGARHGIASVAEEVSISELPPGAHVMVHNGQPCRLNLHMGLTGLTPASYIAILTEGSETAYFDWQAGKVTVIFDDSYDHYVQIDSDAIEPRVILHIAMSCPALLQWHQMASGSSSKESA